MNHIDGWAAWLGFQHVSDNETTPLIEKQYRYGDMRIAIIVHKSGFKQATHLAYMSDFDLVISVLIKDIPKPEYYMKYWIVNDFVFHERFFHNSAPMVLRICKHTRPKGDLPKCGRNDTMLFSRRYGPDITRAILFGQINDYAIQYGHGASMNAPVLDIYYHYVTI